VKKISWQAVGRIGAVASSTAVVCAVLAWGPEAQAPPQPNASDQQLPPLIRSVKGPDLFREYCAPCHGLDGKGNGPAASALKSKVPDLTLLAKQNGGSFPSTQVRKVVTGNSAIPAHGSREMPVWGPIFHQVEEDVDRGNVRIDNLVKYLLSIQVPK